MKKLNRLQIRSKLLKEVKTIFEQDDSEKRIKEFVGFAAKVQEELDELLEDYDKFLDGAESWAMKNGLSNRATIGFLKDRLEKLKEASEGLPFA
jgi:hypothetical protein|tara:strand:+ start:2758 stop:3039 length:282 start_codon:yes stop_codon:yes gene_type:complete